MSEKPYEELTRKDSHLPTAEEIKREHISVTEINKIKRKRLENTKVIVSNINHGIINKIIKQFLIPGKGKSSMRNYDNMSDEEFIAAYEKPYTEAEREENHKIAQAQYQEGKVQELTDQLIDEIFSA